jgi:hypothetical protein
VNTFILQVFIENLPWLRAVSGQYRFKMMADMEVLALGHFHLLGNLLSD